MVICDFNPEHSGTSASELPTHSAVHTSDSAYILVNYYNERPRDQNDQMYVMLQQPPHMLIASVLQSRTFTYFNNIV